MSSLRPSDYKSAQVPDWCSGCGDAGIIAAVRAALAALEVPPHDVVVTSGVGCAAKTVHYLQAYAFHSLHGRAVALATGVKLANPALTVLALCGDGDAYGIGAGQLVGAGRRNADLAVVVMNGSIYSMTKGQPSPTFPRGERTRHMDAPAALQEIDPLALALASGFTFVARAFAYDLPRTTEVIRRAIAHRGTALVDVLQGCPTFGEGRYSKAWAAGTDRDAAPRVRWLGPEHDPVVHDVADAAELRRKRAEAFALATDHDPFALGVFFQAELPTYEDALRSRIPAYAERAPARDERLFGRDLSKLLAALR